MKADGQILSVHDLKAHIVSRRQTVEAVKGVTFDIKRGEAVGFVGESGCGKSITARAIMRLAPEGMRVDLGGSVHFGGRNLLTVSEAEMRDIRGRRIAMVFQDPLTSLNPVLTVGAQIEDILRRHAGLSGHAARERAIELLDQVGIPFPARRIDDYPHQFSGGMRQRALIAIAISCDPDLLIADEPTTALDVTVQAQILRLLLRLREERGMSLMLITHDFGVVAGMVERVNVMYGGRIVEAAGIDEIFRAPSHEYTRALFDAVPRLHREGAES
ncbi:ABC transporter ATP-binding protein [Microvirga lotononidis]|uniref:ABC-type dipeptide/oligopeptide/nickel transport system, ATPase component n=1 Tax=Microvirga lotononidis TaxID=864069 RepID=I4Z162_9HYPH|nr:ABC transporter ATP-binding protein [Microvirga lotononidis]EIM29954.1 ABC-type dipeptide/oligopeptide/nickel transport system, ATPase component [Microvirga lotononidis]WQO31985.1 ABC transporter ATP-binding protein [Microvirga lotononidis]